MNPERWCMYQHVMEQMRQAQHKPVSGQQEKLGTFREASFHRNTSLVAFGGWRVVERVTSDIVVVCVCVGGGRCMEVGRGQCTVLSALIT